MRKTFLTESLARLLRGAIGIACLAAACVSCETHSNSDRSESIAVYADPIEKKPVDAVYVGVQGGQAKIYAEANVDFVASWEDDADMPWAAVLDDTAVDPLTGCRIVTLDVQRRVETGCYYTRRTGMLILAATDGTLNYNRIVPVHQGSTARVSNDFSSMKYGKTDPRFTDDETPIDDWTTAQKDYGFSSTTTDGEEHAHCYGKNGYLKLGDDEGHGADLISPYTNTLRSDSMLMVSFRAVAYTDFYTGAKDDNKIKVEVLDGGVIADFADTGKTSIELEAAYYDPRSDEFPENMWEGSDLLVFVVGTQLNPITVNTRIRISCGSFTQTSPVNNRIFLDNFYIRRLEADEENYFTENNGSGKDIILGAPLEEGQE